MKKVFLILISILLVFTIIIKKNERNIEENDKKREIITKTNCEENQKTNEDIEREETKEDKEESTEIVDKKNDEEIKNTETPTVPKETIVEVHQDIPKNKKSTKNVQKTQKKEEKKTDTVIHESNNVDNNHQKEIESGTVDSSGNEVKEEPKKIIVKEPWEQLGISKEDYENKPLYSWMRVDYNVSNCGSVNNCESLCMNDSEELSYTENVSCIQVYSHSGKYLGEMLKRN